MSNYYAVVLAAGQGTRMKSSLYKVLHPVCGKPMVQHVVDQLKSLNFNEIITIVGNGAQEVKAQLGNDCSYALQKEQLGTAHAVMQAKDVLTGKEGVTLVVCGDTPLIQAETMEKLIDHHEKANAQATVLTVTLDDPTGYGRIVRGPDQTIEKIVEQKDANDEELKIKEVNTGTYCFDNLALFEALTKVSNNNAQKEYYLTDVIEILKSEGKTVTAFQTEDAEETLGVNDRVALSVVEQILRKRINISHMKNGVTIVDPEHTYIDMNVEIGQDTVIKPGTILSGKTKIASNCIIGPNSEIIDSHVGEGTMIRQSVVLESNVGAHVTIGPFAHIRPDSEIHDEVRIGNFVEIKKTVFGERSKASHLSYIGDSKVGSDVNIGCGSITVNYDGENKFETTIEDGAFIGCNSNLIAPVTIGKGAYVAAGSTITDNVPENALTIARARQVNKENYVDKLKKKLKKNNKK